MKTILFIFLFTSFFTYSQKCQLVINWKSESGQLSENALFKFKRIQNRWKASQVIINHTFKRKNETTIRKKSYTALDLENDLTNLNFRRENNNTIVYFDYYIPLGEMKRTKGIKGISKGRTINTRRSDIGFIFNNNELNKNAKRVLGFAGYSSEHWPQNWKLKANLSRACLK